jgi:hypothetical protein
MRLFKHLWNSVFGKARLATAALGGFLLFVGAPSAKANYWDDCNRRAAYADWRYHEAVVHFGFYSPEARYWRHERYEAFARLEGYRRQEWRERGWREHEWREHEWREHRRHYRDRDDDWDGD